MSLISKIPMDLKIFTLRSLKTKVTLTTLVIFLISIWTLSFYSSKTLQKDMERLLGEHQTSTVTFMASEINKGLEDRVKVLQLIATTMNQAMLEEPNSLKKFLSHHFILQTHFNDGVIVHGKDGKAISEFPISAKRIGTINLDADSIDTTLKEGKSMVGRPIMLNSLPGPIFGITVPIYNDKNKIIGALMGITNLGKSNFLDHFTESRYGKTGFYLLEEAKGRLIITGTDKSRVMQPLPPPGVNALIDRHVLGYDETGITINPLGVEVFASAKHIPVANWFIVASLPTEEAFAPIRSMQLRMLFATSILTLFSGSLTWWMLRKQLAPLLVALEILSNRRVNSNYAQLLPVGKDDEIGQLINSFNNLLTTLAQREKDLRESEFRWKFAVEGSGDGLWDWNVTDNKVFFSKRWKEMLGFVEGEIGHGLEEWEKRIHPDDRADTLATVQAYIDGKTPLYISEHRVSCKDGSYKMILDRGMIVSRDTEGQPLRIVGTHTDITERKKVEDQLRDSHETLRGILNTTLDGYWRLDIHGIIFDVNDVYCQKSGYRYEDLIGMRISDLEAAESVAETAKHIQLIIEQGHDQFESIHHRKDGSIWYVEISVTYRFVEGGQFFVFLRDITSRKEAEEEVRKSKQQYDSLVSKIPVGIYLVHTTPVGGFSFDYVSPKMAQMLAVSEKEIYADSNAAFKAIHPEELSAFIKLNEVAIQKYQPFYWEGKLLINGKINWLQITSSPESLENGDVLWHGVAVDITDRKQAENKLVESESRLRTIIENEPECIKIVDAKGKLRQMNPAGLAMIEADSFEQIKGYPVLDVIAPEYREAFADLHRRVIAGESMQMKFEVLGLKGGRRWLETHAVPMEDNGNIVHLAITRDISDHIHAEEALRESEERFRNFFEKNSSVMFLIDPGSGKIIDVNQSAVAYFGYTKTKLIGMHISKINPLPQEILSEEREKVLREERNHFIFLYRLASGEMRDVEVHATPIESGKRLLFFVIVQDITERNQAERALRESEERFRNLFEKNSSVMLLIEPILGEIIDANESAVAYYGYPRAQLIRMSVDDINTLPIDRIAEERRNALQEDRNYFIFEHRLASGDVRDVEVHVTPIESGGRSLLLSIIHDITERKQLERKLRDISIRDSLTNVFNRRYIFERLDTIFSEYLRDNNPFSVLIIDLDFFKNVNDNYGHQAGDLILVEFSAILKNNLRPYDLLGRYGGEEFIIIFINTKKEQIKAKVEGMLNIIRNHTFLYKDTELKITFSGGISDSTELAKSNLSVEKIIEAADSRLYDAKKTGRNKVVMS